MLLFSTGIVIAITLIFILWLRAQQKRKAKLKRDKHNDSVSMLAVMGSGGHTREMLSLIQVLGDHYRPRYYVIAETDTMSEHKVKQTEGSKCQIISIPRSREVKQSYITSVVSTLRALIFSVPLVFRLRPDVILCNGPGTCIPICFAGLLLKVTGLHNTVVVYVESFCRVRSLSLSGKLLYHAIDDFFVQWPELKLKYPRAKFIGRLI